ncbi:uncharacterized protein LOC134005785 [Scomber scombrus]|uniref:uncharacterized protein LOC134005785 n=1 Tax=Scomber scombrus TaxID=13677 RepID=UPI002DDB2581|nr:uncharacterized protein LOC134005785 [Scomber scombrus]
MIWILLLIILASSVCGMFVSKITPTLYQAEENDNITIKWDSQTKTDMSHTNLHCVLQSKSKILYEMINGVEVSESQDEQFAGRVQCDEDALREGRLRLHLFRVTTDDSENYKCDLVAYNKIMKRWVLEASEHFTLNVTQTHHGGTSDDFLTPNITEGGPEEPEDQSYYWDQVKTALGAANCGVLIGACLIFVLDTAAGFLATVLQL